jgi:type I restriction enzyme S subunit
MNQTLEEMAEAQFKLAFTDGVDTNNLSDGWSMVGLGELVDTVSITHKFPKPNIVFLNTSDILEGQVLISHYSAVDTLPGQAKKTIKHGDILYSEIRPENKRYAYVNFDADDYVVSTKLMVLRSKGTVDSLFPYFYLTRQSTIDHLQNMAESRSGTFPQITFDQVKELQLALPILDEVGKFTERVLKHTYDLIFSNNLEAKYLIETRNYLLPKLISGEVIPADLKQLEAVL